MKTIEEIKTELLSQEHSRIFTQNGVKIEMTEEEFIEAINQRAEVLFAKQNYEAELEAKAVEAKAKREALLERLGINEEEARLLLG